MDTLNPTAYPTTKTSEDVYSSIISLNSWVDNYRLSLADLNKIALLNLDKLPQLINAAGLIDFESEVRKFSDEQLTELSKKISTRVENSTEISFGWIGFNPFAADLGVELGDLLRLVGPKPAEKGYQAGVFDG